MDPSISMISRIMYPTALEAAEMDEPQDGLHVRWSDSRLNPKNRIDSLRAVQYPQWQINGSEANGTRYFTIASFMLGKAPMRIDTYLPESSRYPASIRDMLQPDSVMCTPSSQVSSLSISKYILRALEGWSSRMPDLERTYRRMPFGSRIVFDGITGDIRRLGIYLVPNFDIERQWLPVKVLQEMWSLPLASWPEILDIEELKLVQQPHEAISLVRIPRVHESKLYAFKSVLRDMQYFYHELKLLLTLEPHPNIISKPLFLVTKKCRFGGKIGLCGFVLDYHAAGTLQRALSSLSEDPTLRLAAQLRWSKQLISAMQHIQASPIKFYSNLKLINVVMSASKTSNHLNAILIDFEQRSGFFSWSAPEIHYIHYLEHLATFSTNPETCSQYTSMLQSYIPSWKPLDSKVNYRNPQHGYSFPWLALTQEEQEAAQVFMLGKLIWCIFEGVSGTSTCITVETFREESCDLVFPEFLRTPRELRDCIRRCTAGAPEWKGRFPGVVRKGNKLYPADKVGANGGPFGTLEETEAAARRWWREEIQDAKRFLDVRRRMKIANTVDNDSLHAIAFMKERPSLKELAGTVDDFERSIIR